MPRPRQRSSASIETAALLGLLLTAPALGAPSPCGVAHPSDDRVEWECRTLRAGETLESLFGDRWTDVARFNRIDRRHARPGVRIKVPKRLERIDCFTPMPAVYAPAEADSQFVLVDLVEQFLGAYRHGRLEFSAPITSGTAAHPTPEGDFEITLYDRDHTSSLYNVERTRTPYPMSHGLRFYVDRAGIAYWIHGRDLPGHRASHGCIGLYDEAMQQRCYGTPDTPVLSDARSLAAWVTGAEAGPARRALAGIRVRIIAGGARTASGEPADGSR